MTGFQKAHWQRKRISRVTEDGNRVFHCGSEHVSCCDCGDKATGTWTRARYHQPTHCNASILVSSGKYLSTSYLVTAEVFTVIGQLEFFYDQSPDAMRSLCMALALLAVSLGSYLSSAILSVGTWLTTRGGQARWIPNNLTEGHLDYYFWVLAGKCTRQRRHLEKRFGLELW